jgi:hypothetical protein
VSVFSNFAWSYAIAYNELLHENSGEEANKKRLFNYDCFMQFHEQINKSISLNVLKTLILIYKKLFWKQKVLCVKTTLHVLIKQ